MSESNQGVCNELWQWSTDIRKTYVAFYEQVAVLRNSKLFHRNISPQKGNGPTQGQKKILTSRGFEPLTSRF